MSFTLNNCTLDSKFAQAVRQGLTVRQAMDQGFLNSEAFFGYSAFRGRGQEEQPLVSEGYGYDNMKRLRPIESFLLAGSSRQKRYNRLARHEHSNRSWISLTIAVQVLPLG